MKDFRCKNCGTWIDTIYTYDNDYQISYTDDIDDIGAKIGKKAHCTMCGAEYAITPRENAGGKYDELTETIEPKAKVINVAYHMDKLMASNIPEVDLGNIVKRELANKFVDYILENKLVTYEVSESPTFGTTDLYGFLRLVEPGVEL